MRVSLNYTCPVTVIVDLDTGEVDQVVVFDEGITPDPDDVARDADTSEPVSGDEMAQSYAIADGGAEWPSWDLGF
jgi:hypothetical protein